MNDARAAAPRIGRLGGRIAALQKGLPNRDRILLGAEHGLMSATAALLAYWPAEALGFQQSFWGAITAIAVVQTEYAATRTTARDQFAGAAIGGLVGAGAVVAVGQHWAAYALAVVVAIVVSWLGNVATASRLAGVTATIIFLVPHEGSALRVMLVRVSEVGWGVAVAIAVVWIVSRMGLTPKSRDKKEAAKAEAPAGPR